MSRSVKYLHQREVRKLFWKFINAEKIKIRREENARIEIYKLFWKNLSPEIQDKIPEDIMDIPSIKREGSFTRFFVNGDPYRKKKYRIAY